MGKHATVDWTGQSIYIGIDVHVKSWKVSIHTATIEHHTFSQAPQATPLAAYLARHFPGATVQAVYEAGPCGFAPYRQLTATGIPCIVVHPPDVPTTDKQRRRKTDRRDARKLARLLRAGHLTPIAVPSPEREADRSLLRLRQTLTKERTRIKNRIKSWCRMWDVPVPAGCRSPQWSQSAIAHFRTLTGPPASALTVLTTLLDTLEALTTQRTAVSQQITTLTNTPRYAAEVTLLTSIPGVGLISAMTWLTELGPIKRYEHFDGLCSYVGLVPGERSSGESTNVTGLDRRGNPRLRTVLIQNAWTAVRKDPALLHSFEQLQHRMPKQQAIIRIARKLLRRLYRILRTGEPYVLGVVQ